MLLTLRAHARDALSHVGLHRARTIPACADRMHALLVALTGTERLSVLADGPCCVDRVEMNPSELLYPVPNPTHRYKPLQAQLLDMTVVAVFTRML